MDDWKNFSGTTAPEKEGFYSYLNIADITDADYAHRKIVCKDFKIKNLGKYHNLFAQINTLLLADVFEIFRNMFPETY